MTPAGLWTQHRPLARKVASRFSIVGADRDDVNQEAMIALWEAARTYNPEKGASFRTFAERVIHNHLDDCVKASLRGKQQPLSNAVRSLDGDTTVILESLPHLHQVSDRAEEREQIGALLQAIGNLPDFQRRCVLGIASGLSYLEIGDPKRVDKHLYRARVKLRTALAFSR